MTDGKAPAERLLHRCANGAPDISRFAACRSDKICPPAVISRRRADIQQTVRLAPRASITTGSALWSSICSMRTPRSRFGGGSSVDALSDKSRVAWTPCGGPQFDSRGRECEASVFRTTDLKIGGSVALVGIDCGSACCRIPKETRCFCGSSAANQSGCRRQTSDGDRFERLDQQFSTGRSGSHEGQRNAIVAFYRVWTAVGVANRRSRDPGPRRRGSTCSCRRPQPSTQATSGTSRDTRATKGVWK